MKKPISRRSVTTGLAAAVTAIPAVGLCVAARGDPLARIKHCTQELERALAEHYPGAEILTLGGDMLSEETVSYNPYIFVCAQLPPAA